MQLIVAVLFVPTIAILLFGLYQHQAHNRGWGTWLAIWGAVSAGVCGVVMFRGGQLLALVVAVPAFGLLRFFERLPTTGDWQRLRRVGRFQVYGFSGGAAVLLVFFLTAVWLQAAGDAGGTAVMVVYAAFAAIAYGVGLGLLFRSLRRLPWSPHRLLMLLLWFMFLTLNGILWGVLLHALKNHPALN